MDDKVFGVVLFKGYIILAKLGCCISESSFKKDKKTFDFESPLFVISSFSMKIFSVPISFLFFFLIWQT